jgi:hypothetical protein
MSVILIKADSKSNKILTTLAKRLGGKVVFIKDEQYEDLALGSMMDKVKTNETVSREQVLKNLESNDWRI